MAVIAFPKVRIGEMLMTAIFMLSNRKSKYFRGKKVEIARGFNRKV